mgnify:CR=1 FL=1|tara:strand:+ start:383 stop:658 length:276 start_codon:yes stop_codon:yes gene_type:complete
MCDKNKKYCWESKIQQIVTKCGDTAHFDYKKIDHENYKITIVRVNPSNLNITRMYETETIDIVSTLETIHQEILNTHTKHYYNDDSYFWGG